MATTPDEYQLWSADDSTVFNPKAITLAMVTSISAALNAFKNKYGVPNFSNTTERNAAFPGGATPSGNYVCRVLGIYHYAYNGAWHISPPPGRNGVKVSKATNQSWPVNTSTTINGAWSIVNANTFGNGYTTSLSNPSGGQVITLTRAGIWAVNFYMQPVAPYTNGGPTSRRFATLSVGTNTYRQNIGVEDQMYISAQDYYPAGSTMSATMYGNDIGAGSTVYNVTMSAYQLA